MKKPSRAPPPPPPPPRCRSPARSFYSLPRQAGSCAGGSGSEYAESVSSMPSRLPIICQCNSPATSAYQSCRSETGFSLDFGRSTSSNYACSIASCPSTHKTSSCNYSETCCSESRWSCTPTQYHLPSHRQQPQHQHPHQQHQPQQQHQHQQPHPIHNSVVDMMCSACITPTCFRSHSPCASTHSHHSNHLNLSNNSCVQNHGSVCMLAPVQPQPIQPSPVPIPRARVSRPRLSISPLPELKNKSDSNDSHREIKFHDWCKSLYYRRHVEQHIEKVFKYIEERKQRRELGYEGIKITGENAETILGVLNYKESLHLRSLRTPIRKDDFKEIQKLGAGFIGDVWLVKKVPRYEAFDGPVNLYAMKKLKKSQVFEQNHLAHVMAERDILAEADNEWIVKLYYSFQDRDYLYFILDYIPGGDMMNLLCMQSVFPEEWACFYIAEISIALQFVHDKGFIHRDIKPDNILIDAKGHIKLTDFGLCTGFRWTHDSRYYVDDTQQNTIVQQNDISPFNGNGSSNHNTSINDGNNGFNDHPTITEALTKRAIEHSTRHRALSLVGSPNYIAPEVLRQTTCQPEGANERLCDWWSVGVILYEMVIGYCPFINLNMLKLNKYDPNCDPPADIQARILHWRDHLAFPSPTDPNGPPQMPDASGNVRYIRESTRNLIKGLLCDPQDRLCQNGIRDIMEHPFFQGYPFVGAIGWDNIRSSEAPYVPRLKDEFDTTHFEQFSQSSEPENLISSGAGTVSARMPINHFTFKTYWPNLKF